MIDVLVHLITLCLITATDMVKLPEMKWDTHDNADDFKIFKQRLQLFLLDIGLEDE